MARTATQTRKALQSQTETRVTAILATAMFGGPVAREYVTDSKGRKVRVFTRENPCSPADIRELLVNVRVVEEEEALEVIGKNAFRYFIERGFLRKVGAFYAVTRACAEAYGLPAYLGPRTFTA